MSSEERYEEKIMKNKISDVHQRKACLKKIRVILIRARYRYISTVSQFLFQYIGTVACVVSIFRVTGHRGRHRAPDGSISTRHLSDRRISLRVDT